MSTHRSARRIGRPSVTGIGSIDEVEVRRAAVGNVRLAPRLHRERHHDERVQQLQQVLRVVGHLVERELVAVRDRVFGAREERVVERLHRVHGAGHALREALALGRAGTTSRRTAPGRRTRLGSNECSSTFTPPGFALVVVDPVGGDLVEVAAQDLLVVQRERRDDARLEHDLRRFEGVAVLQAYSLNVTAAISCARRSRAVFAGTK